MFNKRIRETPFTKASVDGYFNIYGNDIEGDISFLATLRALLHKRSCGATVNLYERNLEGYRCSDPEIFFNEVSRFAERRDSITIIQLLCNATELAKAFNLCDSGLSEEFGGYQAADDLNVFVQTRGKIDIRFYINEASRSTIIVSEALSFPNNHLIQAIIPRLLPWFFTSSPLTEVERELLNALTKRTSADYERILSALAEDLDFRGFAIRKIVGDFDKIGRQEELKNTKAEIERLRAQINDNIRKYASLMIQMDDMNVRLNGQMLAVEAAADGSELVDYFVCNKNLVPTGTHERTLSFEVKTFFEFFDPEQYRTYIARPESFLYKGYSVGSGFADAADRKLLLDAIFADEPTVRVKMCSAYCINLRGTVEGYRYYDYGTDYQDYIPNPHIHQYACLGNYRPLIQKALNEGNLIGAIEQCVASAKSLNLAEAHTVRYFLEDLFGRKTKVLKLQDGRDVTPLEALEYLKGGNNNNV